MNDAATLWAAKPQANLLTESLRSKLKNPEQSSDFDLYSGVNQVLNDVGMSTADSGGKLSFYRRDPPEPGTLRFEAV
jgi:hypothetical protein